jgi:hypothetical protein
MNPYDIKGEDVKVLALKTACELYKDNKISYESLKLWIPAETEEDDTSSEDVDCLPIEREDSSEQEPEPFVKPEGKTLMEVFDEGEKELDWIESEEKVNQLYMTGNLTVEAVKKYFTPEQLLEAGLIYAFDSIAKKAKSKWADFLLVRCIDDIGMNGRLTIGKTYEAKPFYQGEPELYELTGDDGKTDGFYRLRFERVEK